MSILTLARYLVGSSAAICEIAGNRHSLWIGLLFVLSAGFAREYDGEDLLHEPWYVVIPVAASLGASFMLYLVAFAPATGEGGVSWRRFFPGYLSFLGLFWMTAPLAWLYAVPYEQFLSPVEAMRANLWTLGVVSAWRVALMVRVLAVLFRYTHLQAFVLVFAFATVVANVVIVLAPVQLVEIMSGSRLSSDRDQLMRQVAGVVVGCSCYMVLLGPIVAGLILPKSTPAWQFPAPASARPGSLSWLAVASLAVWPFVLPHTQPPQQRRREVEKLYAAGRVAEALEAMSRHPQSDYPPGWDPPPRALSFRHRWEQAPVLDLLEELEKSDAPEWVREAYLDRLAKALCETGHVEEENLRRLAGVLQRIPEGTTVIDRFPTRTRSGTTDDTLESLRRLIAGEGANDQQFNDRKSR